jgi:hypothetical protein
MLQGLTAMGVQFPVQQENYGWLDYNSNLI